jgi:rRNA maturation protein Nop10
MDLKKCPEHGYTLQDSCPKCNKPSKEAHYKFIKIRDAPKEGIKGKN